MLFRPSMTEDIERAKCLEGVSLIYSLWSGYLKDGRYQWFIDWLDKHQVPIIRCHTSGHASLPDLQKLANAISAKRLVPIHTFEPDSYKLFFDNVEKRKDGEIWTV